MQSLKHLCSIGLLATVLAFAQPVKAQQFFNTPFSGHTKELYGKYNQFNFEIIAASKEQREAVEQAKAAYQQDFAAVVLDFLYPDDEKAADDQNFQKMEEKIQAILTTEQMDKLNRLVAGDKELLKDFYNPVKRQGREEYVKNLANYYSSEYEYLDITAEQAKRLAERQADMVEKGENDTSEELMAVALEEMLTPAQFELYKARLAEIEAEEAQADWEYSGEGEDAEEISNEIENKYEEEITANLEEEMKDMRLVISILKDYYKPERANIRTGIQPNISNEDRLALQRLRERYVQYAEVELAKMEPMGNLYPTFNQETADMFKEMQNLDAIDLLDMQHGNGSSLLVQFLKQDRSTFYAARDMAKRYDKLIDGVYKENDLLIFSMILRILPIVSRHTNNMPNEAELQMMKSYIVQESYDTKDIEYARNITFLLVNPGEVDAAQLHSSRLAHELSVFPVPAADFQTLDFTLAADGNVQLDIVSQDGKLLKTLQSGPMQKGVHTLKVDIQDLPTGTFFYRIVDGKGTSLVKSLRAE